MITEHDEIKVESVAIPPKQGWGKIFRAGKINWVFLVALLLTSTSLNILLAQKLSTLKITIENLKSEGRLKEGTQLPPFEAKGLDENTVTLSYNETTPTILYTFSPQCGWCSRNLQNLKALSNAVRGKYRFIGLSLSDIGLQEYSRQHNFDFPVYTGISESVKQSYKFGGTPQTIVVSDVGKVLKVWTGAYQGSIQEGIEDYFDVRLPGIVNDIK
jgi:peroxiredoxin